MTAPRRRRRVWGVCVLAGLVLVTGGVVLAVNRPGSAPAAHGVPVVNLGALSTAGSGSGAGSNAARPPSSPPRAAATQPGSSHTPVPPGSRLRFARLGVDAAITDVAAVDNVMQIPRNPRIVGWWTGGAAPGDTRGNTVIVGHINYSGVAGALSVLPAARPGDLIVLSEGQRDRRYRVVAIRTYPKTSGIPAAVFSRSGPAGLILITCGGPFDGATGNYEDNIVAYTEPA